MSGEQYPLKVLQGQLRRGPQVSEPPLELDRQQPFHYQAIQGSQQHDPPPLRQQGLPGAHGAHGPPTDDDPVDPEQRRPVLVIETPPGQDTIRSTPRYQIKVGFYSIASWHSLASRNGVHSSIQVVQSDRIGRT